jgi:2-polyprenyl-6-methoxyphenol hydroxylase-like FAD-dependent oxidoreductase
MQQSAIPEIQPLRLLIVGGGTAGWLTALMLAWHFRQHQQVQIELVEAPGIATIGVGEGSTPALTRLLRQLEIAEQDWMPACQATYKNGIRFSHWSTQAGYQHYFHPFPSSTDNAELAEFFQRVRSAQLDQRVIVHPDPFFLQTTLAQQGKAPFCQAPGVQLQYGYHFDAGLLGQCLKKIAIERGIRYRPLTVTTAQCHSDGAIAQLATAEGVSLQADFYFDCTGFTGKLSRQALGGTFHSYRQMLPNNAALTIATAAQQQPLTQTTATALRHGWCWQIPLQHRTGNGYVFSRDFISADMAETELRQHLGLSEQEGSSRLLTFEAGRLQQHWQHNCLAVGLSQGFIEPLEATALYLVQQTVGHFLLHWQQSQYQCRGELRLRSNYNQLINDYFDNIADYIVLHYKTNSRTDSAYWQHNRQRTSMSPRLEQLLQCWQNGADLPDLLAELKLEKYYHSVSWYCLLAGTGSFPALRLHGNPLSAPTLAQDQQRQQRWQQLATLCPQQSEQLAQLAASCQLTAAQR